MEPILDVYSQNYGLIAQHVLMLVAIIVALVRIGVHPGPSICVILAALINFGCFFVQFAFDYDYGHDMYRIIRYAMQAGWFASAALLYVAVFGWRSRRQPAYEQDYGGHAYGMGQSYGGYPGVAQSPAPQPGAAQSYEAQPSVTQAAWPQHLASVRIPVGWAVAVTALPFVAVPLLFGGGALAATAGDEERMIAAIVFLVLLGLASYILQLVFVLMILYRGWAAIQDGQARTSPGKAVGFLFIPFYNFYWIFVAWAGLAKDFNAFVSRYGLGVRRLSEGLFMAQCIMSVVGIVVNFIPFVNVIYNLTLFVMMLVMLWSITGAVNELHDCVAAYGRSPAPETSPENTPIPDTRPPEDYAPPGYQP